MDPNATLTRLISALAGMRVSEAYSLATDLDRWVINGGFHPINPDWHEYVEMADLFAGMVFVTAGLPPPVEDGPDAVLTMLITAESSVEVMADMLFGGSIEN